MGAEPDAGSLRAEEKKKEAGGEDFAAGLLIFGDERRCVKRKEPALPFQDRGEGQDDPG